MPLARLIVLLPLAALAGCHGPVEPAVVPPGAAHSAILVTLDTTRADSLGVYGGPPGLAPELDRLAREGVLYEQARSVAPITLPSHASMLTGLYPPRHTVRDNSLHPVPPSASTLAERAAERGLETGAFVASIVLDRAFGLDQGFGTYDTPSRQSRRRRQDIGLYDERPGSEVVAAAVDWLRGLDADARFFAWVHLFDPHMPYEPPEEAQRRAGGNAYLGEVAAMDGAVGTLVSALRELGRLERTLVVVVADHGESLGEHGESTHGVFCYDTTMRVPFFLRYPDGHAAGERRPEVVSVVDVFPTLIDGLGLGDPGEVDGASLYRRRTPDDRGAYFESFYGAIHYGWAPLVGWIDAGGKYVHGRPPEFWDVRADPQEGSVLPLAAADRALYVGAIRGVLAAAGLEAQGQVAPQMLERLEALGYATAGSRGGLDLPDPLAESDLPNPRDRLHEIRRVEQAVAALQRDRIDEAIALFGSVVAENPRNATAVEFLAPALIETGRCADAIPLLEGLIDAGIARALTHVNLGRCLESDGRDEEAAAQYRTASEIEPANPAVLRKLAGQLEKLGHDAESLEVRRRLEALGG
jgi:arylsulfatase A-like enzyme